MNDRLIRFVMWWECRLVNARCQWYEWYQDWMRDCHVSFGVDMPNGEYRATQFSFQGYGQWYNLRRFRCIVRQALRSWPK